MRNRRTDEPGMWQDPRWWLMVAVWSMAIAVITVGLLPGTGLTDDARATAVIGGIVFGGWAVQDSWAWWRRRRHTLVGFVAELWSALIGPGQRPAPEDQAAVRFLHSPVDRLAADVARLCTRDGLADVRTEPSARDPREADVSATAPDDTVFVVRVRGYRPGRGTAVGGGMMRRFIAEAVEHEPGTAVHAYAGSSTEEQGAAFTAPARRAARRYGIVMLSAEELGLWEIGRPARALAVVPRTGE